MTPTRPSITPKFDILHLVGPVAMVAPACRTVVVEVWADRGETGHLVHPVLALQSVVTTEYSRVQTRGQRDNRSAIAERLEDAGWSCDWSYPRVDAVIVDPESGELVEAARHFDASNVASRVVPCPWDEAMDDERLKPFIAMTTRAAIAKATTSGFWPGPIDVQTCPAELNQ